MLREKVREEVRLKVGEEEEPRDRHQRPQANRRQIVIESRSLHQLSSIYRAKDLAIAASLSLCAASPASWRREPIQKIMPISPERAPFESLAPIVPPD